MVISISYFCIDNSKYVAITLGFSDTSASLMFAISAVFFSFGNFLANLVQKSGYIKLWVVFEIIQFLGLLICLSGNFYPILFAISL